MAATDYPNLSPEEQNQLLDLVEQYQADLAAQKAQVDELLSLNNRLINSDKTSKELLEKEQELKKREEELQKAKSNLQQAQSELKQEKSQLQSTIADIQAQASKEVAAAQRERDYFKSKTAKDRAAAARCLEDAETIKANQQREVREKAAAMIADEKASLHLEFKEKKEDLSWHYKRKHSELAVKEKEVEELQQAVKNQQAALDQLYSEEESKIEQRSTAKIERIKADCNAAIEKTRREQKALYVARRAKDYALYIFCVMVVFINAIFTPKTAADVVGVGKGIGAYLSWAWNVLAMWAVGAKGASAGISNVVIGNIVGYGLLVLVGILVFALFYLVPAGVIGLTSYGYFTSERFLKYNKWIMVSTGVLWFAVSSVVTWQVNLFFIWLLIQLIVPLLQLAIEFLKNKYEDDPEKFKSVALPILWYIFAIGLFIALMSIIF